MKAFLFDLDGTLTDPREGITRSIAYGSREELEAHGAQHYCASPRDLPAALARLRAPT